MGVELARIAAEQTRQAQVLAQQTQVQLLQGEVARIAAEQMRQAQVLAQQTQVQLLMGERQLAALHALAPAPTPLSITTAARVGSSVLDALGAAIIIYEEPLLARAEDDESADGGLAPVFTAALLARLRSCATEAELVGAATPALRAARALEGSATAAAAAIDDPCALVLVNSEIRAWLDALHGPPLPAAQRLKPDLFVTWAPCWKGISREAAAPLARSQAARCSATAACASFTRPSWAPVS